MEHAVFLVLPHQKKQFVSILSWNINGARTKLEKVNVYNFVSDYDIISLNETKTPLDISIPGYISYKSKRVTGKASLRGGTVVLVRNCLASQVYNIDNSMTDQVWFQLRCIPYVLFGFCYIPPTDSSYFNHQLFANLHDKMVDFNDHENICIIGDMNARFGATVRNIPVRSNNSYIQSCSYPTISDDTLSPNDSSYILSFICLDNDLVVLNNIKTPFCHFPSLKTFIQRNQWISEIDTIVTSYGMLKSVEDFGVYQTDWLPSNHAPISVNIKLPKVNLDILLARAEYLGGHASLMGHDFQDRLTNRPIRYEHIDISAFSNMIGDIPLPLVDNNDANLLADNISRTLYDC